MDRNVSHFAITGLMLCLAATPSLAQDAASARAAAEQKQSRYQIGQMERVLEGAVEHGLTMNSDRLQAFAPFQTMLLDSTHVRGFRLVGYGVFFDVAVPSIDTSTTWSLRTLDQNDLGLQSAINRLRSHVNTVADVDLQQALQRVEIQLGPGAPSSPPPGSVAGARNAVGAPASIQSQDPRPSAQQPPSDPILDDPAGAYRREVIVALVDAMLDHSGALGVGPDEWLTIGVKRNEDRPRLAPADSDAQTFVIRVRGADLAAFRGAQISREEVTKRIEVRVF
jgi:hypothetical protein